MRDIVIASGNPHKIRELAEILARVGARAIPLQDASRGATLVEPEETGDTFEANAAIKATSYARQTGMWCLADDSGLEVDALNGAPGIHSARYAALTGEARDSRDATDTTNNTKLLRELQDVPERERTARFVCAIAVADAQGNIVANARGTFEGRIGIPPDVPRGSNGFGYDPLFVLPDPGSPTSAELDPDQKNRRSHRAKAAEQLVRQLKETTH